MEETERAKRDKRTRATKGGTKEEYGEDGKERRSQM